VRGGWVGFLWFAGGVVLQVGGVGSLGPSGFGVVGIVRDFVFWLVRGGGGLFRGVEIVCFCFGWGFWGVWFVL